MIEIGIDPVALSFGTFSIRWFSIVLFFAVLTAMLWTIRAAKAGKYFKDTIYPSTVLAIVGGVLVARLLHVFDQIDFYVVNPEKIIGLNGMAVYGAILGASLFVWIYSKIRHFSFAHLADLVAPGVLAAHVIGNLGCFIDGSCYGKPTSIIWGVLYTHPNSYAPMNIAIHPVPVYELIWSLLVLGIVWFLRGKLRPSGSLFAVYLVLYTVGKIAISITRDAGSVGTVLWGWMLQAQFIGMLVLVLAVPWMVLKIRWVRNSDVNVIADQGDLYTR